MDIRTFARYAIAVVCLSLIGCGGCSEGYQKVNGEWAWVGWNAGRGSYVIKLHADNETFVVLGDKRYAKDKNYVFLKSETIDGADPSTFQLLGVGKYAKDKSHVFLWTSRIDGADPSTFQLLGVGFYSKDKSHVFLGTLRIPGADPDSFRIIGEPYGRDKTTLFCGTVPMETADIDAFEVVKFRDSSWFTYTDKNDFLFHYGPAFSKLEISKNHPVEVGNAWARDSKYWYYGPGRVEGADYASIKIDVYGEASDKNRQYIGVFPKEELDERRKRYIGIKNP